jgi:hypothetical protein
VFASCAPLPPRVGCRPSSFKDNYFTGVIPPSLGERLPALSFYINCFGTDFTGRCPFSPSPEPTPTPRPPSSPEQAALRDLYMSTRGSQWLGERGASATGNLCLLSGVVCERGRVVSLVLASRGLSGTLPSTLSALRFLT